MEGHGSAGSAEREGKCARTDIFLNKVDGEDGREFTKATPFSAREEKRQARELTVAVERIEDEEGQRLSKRKWMVRGGCQRA